MPKFYVGSGGSSGGGGGSVNTAPVTVAALSGTVTPIAAVGNLFRHTANADVVLAAPTAGTDGQQIVIEILANGADRSLQIGDSTDLVSIPSGTWWTARLIYHAADDEWVLTEDDGGSAAIPRVLYSTRASSHSTDITLDAAAAGNNFSLTVTANVAFNVPTGLSDHQALQVVILASGGTRTITLSGSFARVVGINTSYAVPSGKLLRLSLRYSALNSVCLVEAAALQQ